MNQRFTCRMAAILALGMSLLMHFFILLIYFFGRNAILADHGGLTELPSWDLSQVTLSFSGIFVFSFLMFMLNFKIIKSDIRKHRILIIIVSSIVATLLLTYLLIHIQWFVMGYDPGAHYNKLILGNMIRDFFLSIVVIFITQILYLSHKKQQIALENEKLFAENMQSRYETLKNQVDPHFLFNTLNTLNSMIKVDPDKAQEYVQKMSSVFRYTLQHKEETTLEEELKFTSDYCLLMQIRYGESLIIKMDIDKALSNYHIVPLSIQTLVENAIKHNVVRNRQPLTITIATGENETLIVSNPLQKKKVPEQGEGIGLPNLSERYLLCFGREIEVSCTDSVFQVILPLIKPKTA